MDDIWMETRLKSCEENNKAENKLLAYVSCLATTKRKESVLCGHLLFQGEPSLFT